MHLEASMHRFLVTLILCAAPLFIACGPKEIYAKDYDQTCESTEDCALVFEGDPCTCGDETAVNAAAKEEYKRDWDAAQRFCGLRDNCDAINVTDDITTDVGCSDGICQAFDKDFTGGIGN
jgi:hypothetical protein